MPSETADFAGPAGPPGRPARRVLRSVVGLLVIAAVAWLARDLALDQGLRQLHIHSAQRLEVEAARLDGQLGRFEYLPSLLETSPEVLRLLEAPPDPALVDRVNRYLAALNAIAGADNLYVQDASGRALAAADFDAPGTPVGQDLSYRPYFRDALAQGRGRFYGVGITSARAGYYLSYALASPAGGRGVATVKVNLEAIEREWGNLPYRIALADEHQVVILASDDRWRYHPLQPLSADTMAEANRARRYGDAVLSPVDWHLRERVGEQAIRVAVDGVPFLASEHLVNLDRWRLIMLADERPVVTAAGNVAISAALATLVLLLLLALAAQRKRALRQRLASREALQAAHDSLERKVQERTAELQAAQNELVHAGKLAVLGQMSAGVVHELNQPLAALHTLSDNAALLIERGRHDEARTNLTRIGQLVARLGRLTSQLKVFAHKSDVQLGPVQVQKVVAEALALVSTRLRASAIETVVRIEPPTLTVLGDAARLEQVLINLLGNAVDALDSQVAADGSAGPGGAGGAAHGAPDCGGPIRRIEVIGAVHAAAGVVDGVADGEANAAAGEIVVRNTGPAIDPALLPRLFEPFVTTKPAGRGLGLGLVISSQIIRSFGGTLVAGNLEPAGVAFVIRLPRPTAIGGVARTDGVAPATGWLRPPAT